MPTQVQVVLGANQPRRPSSCRATCLAGLVGRGSGESKVDGNVDGLPSDGVELVVNAVWV